MKLIKAVTKYVTYRKSLGELFLTNESFLKSFARSVGIDSNLADIKPEQINVFLRGKATITATWHGKHQALRGFYCYAISRGLIKISPLPTVIPKRPAPFVPYIYSRKELRSLLDASLTYQKNRSQYAPYVVQTLIFLLYGAGLRLKEGASLTLADVDLERSFLTIRETKFHKTRLVPIGTQLSQVLSQYAAKRKNEGHSQCPDSPFFITRSGKHINQWTIEGAFQRIRKQANVHRSDGAHYQPRLHDLRHSFAVHRLTAWYKQKADVQKWLPVLSVYLGHEKLAATSIYLSMTPALLHQANLRFETYAVKENTHD
jgi:site-specific recombinase XerD